MARVSFNRDDISVRKVQFDTPFLRPSQKGQKWAKVSNIIWASVFQIGLATAVVLVLRWIYFRWFYEQVWVVVDEDAVDSSLRSQKDSILWKIVRSLFLGSAISAFTFLITYMDSEDPGISPPSPLSPRTLRERSGHMLHLCYAIAIINGILVFVYSLWSMW